MTRTSLWGSPCGASRCVRAPVGSVRERGVSSPPPTSRTAHFTCALLVDPGRADHARLRDRHRPPVLDLRARTGRRDPLRSDDHPATCELPGSSRAEVLRQLGVRRYAAARGRAPGENVARLRAALGLGPQRDRLPFVGRRRAVTPRAWAWAGAGRACNDLPALLRDRERVDELIVTDYRLRRARAAGDQSSQTIARGVEVRIAPKATELSRPSASSSSQAREIPLFELR